MAANVKSLVGQASLNLVTQFPVEFNAGLGGMRLADRDDENYLYNFTDCLLTSPYYSGEELHALEAVLRSVMLESDRQGNVQQQEQASQPSHAGRFKGLDLSKYTLKV